MGHRVSSLLLRAVETLIFCYVSLEFAVTSALVSSLNVVGEELSFAVVRPSGTQLAINRLEVGCVK